MSAQLYRHWGQNDELLYVGVSLSAVRRLAAHKSSRWFGCISKVTIETFESRATALAAEKEAIKKEKPLMNVVFNAEAAVSVPPTIVAVDAIIEIKNKCDPCLHGDFSLIVTERSSPGGTIYPSYWVRCGYCGLGRRIGKNDVHKNLEDVFMKCEIRRKVDTHFVDWDLDLCHPSEISWDGPPNVKDHVAEIYSDEVLVHVEIVPSPI